MEQFFYFLFMQSRHEDEKHNLFLSFILVVLFYKEYKSRGVPCHVILSIDTQHNVGQVWRFCT
jgi:hypothetical protein